MRCERARAMMSERADGAWVDGDVLDVHLSRCASCRSFGTSIERVRRELRIAPVRHRVEVTQAVLGATAVKPDDLKRRRRVWWGAAAMLLTVAAGGAFLSSRSSRTTEVATGPQAPVVSVQADEERVASGQSVRGPKASVAAVWTRDELDPTLAPALEPMVDVLTVVRRETVLLTGSIDPDGSTIDDVESGWAIPLDVAAVDPVTYAAAVDGAGTVTNLSSGEGLLSESSAKLRGLGVGAVLEFGGLDIAITAVVADEVVGAAELMVDYGTGEQLGVMTPRYTLVRSGLDSDELAAAIPAAVRSEARIRSDGETAWLRNSDAVAPQAQIKLMFGEFAIRPAGDGFDVDPRWFADNVVTTEVRGLGQLTCHVKVVALLEEVLAGFDQETLEVIEDAGFNGCWNPRQIRATGDLSRHSWGAAIDLGGLPDDSTTAQRIVDAFTAAGFSWGGNWLVPDPVHFEFVGEAAGAN